MIGINCRSFSTVLCLVFGLLSFNTANAAELVLHHTVPGKHPRLKYLNQVVDGVHQATGGAVKIRVNPNGVQYKGIEELRAVMDGRIDLTVVNTSYFETIRPEVGFMNLPFTLSDDIMDRPGVPGRLILVLQQLLGPNGLKVLAVIRGADQLFVFKERKAWVLKDMAGLRIRVAGPGIYEEIMRALDAQPVIVPVANVKEAFAKNRVDGVFTSPGGWITLLNPSGKTAVQASGLMVVTYLMVANKSSFEKLSVQHQQALEDAARIEVMNRWDEMRRQDAEIIKKMVAAGKTFVEMRSDEAALWKEKQDRVRRAFAEKYPDVIKQYMQAIESP